MVKVTPVRVVALWADPNVFSMTLAMGGGGGRRWEKGTPSPQRSLVLGRGTRSLRLGMPRHMSPFLE
jgi:hypothetical protein